ncbi:KLTH0F01628p [Lachancea thermotolerans CBS 6340]|uniref:KLTH0F01628p n=1 Tax=Lachancea thermotolerans (strain ATCC 56472 / CBS 6340 / NRRL Y-8284) TaxID=559295 RepID=C5DK43_LACTC|nr:KLTH0F01628p [Lachancea thermotolerans CBS 6340]CAR23844.1 KLTH0F01628p [Lachancea thermotolerans CBS 6340]
MRGPEESRLEVITRKGVYPVLLRALIFELCGRLLFYVFCITADRQGTQPLNPLQTMVRTQTLGTTMISAVTSREWCSDVRVFGNSTRRASTRLGAVLTQTIGYESPRSRARVTASITISAQVLCSGLSYVVMCGCSTTLAFGRHCRAGRRLLSLHTRVPLAFKLALWPSHSSLSVSVTPGPENFAVHAHITLQDIIYSFFPLVAK